MRIKLSEDRKRLLISIGSALVLHFSVLLLIGMNKLDYHMPQEFGPITVEISLNKPHETSPPEPENEQPQALNTEETSPAAAEAETPVPAPEPVVEKVVKPVVRPVKPSTPAVQTPPRSYTAEVPDAGDVDAIKPKSSTGGIDAKAVFGDNPVPSTTSTPQPLTAAGSTVVPDRDSRQTAGTASSSAASAAESEPAEVKVVTEGALSRLDEQLNSVTASQTSVPAASIRPAGRTTPGSASAQSSLFKFDNPALSREFLGGAPPVIPEDVQTAGIPKYTVVIEFYIDSDGLTSESRIKQPSTDSRIDAAVQAALREWRFAESKDSGSKKVRATLTYVIEIK